MELEIQKYLRSGKTLQDLAWDYDIKFYSSYIYPNLVVFDYTVLSPKDNQIVREARGLVLEKDTWNLVSKSMSGFSFKSDSNYEDILSVFDWPSAKAFQKYDGCLITLYNYQDEWITGTRFSVDGECNVASAYSEEIQQTWKELFVECVDFLGVDYNELTSKLDKDCTYSFELCSIKNKNIVIYENKFVKILSILRHSTLAEEDIFENELFLQNYPIFLPDFVKVDSYQECIELVDIEKDPTQFEGMVVIDKNFNRIKIRSQAFDKLSYNLNPQSELEALDNIFYVLLDNLSPYSSGPSYCYWNYVSKLRYCLSSNSSSENLGPFNECTGSSDCDSIVLYCYIDINSIEQSRCYPAGYTNIPTNFIATGAVCGEDPCPDPISGGGSGGGGGPLSIMSSDQNYRVCSSSWNPKLQDNQKLYLDLAKSFVNMCNWIMNEFRNFRNGDTSSEEMIRKVWFNCFDLLLSGKSISEIIMIEPKQDQLDAVKRFISLGIE